ncbi:glycoside hydrolase superfamily [Polychytrium aggregatum]|uniref:glycoside hydrolase superfamily n=1 Tax=Polychytrium aggregatum TaxID=110093 RepID=UPI0022FF09E0|nr:glycoside hydrolase superfamily [Polychytrium aggregatum]KAI9199306.1 glycoside hydrolase superfamily [Polychytrium aggregatum]
MKQVKSASPNLRFLISIGGWTDSNLFSPATEAKYIDKFVTSIVKFVQFFGFDGVDFDWEYPVFEHGGQAINASAPVPAGTFNNLLSKTRAAFNAIGKTANNENYLISVAAPSGYENSKMDLPTVCGIVDYVNVSGSRAPFTLVSAACAV